jgi:hypothetical protein
LFVLLKGQIFSGHLVPQELLTQKKARCLLCGFERRRVCCDVFSARKERQAGIRMKKLF